MLDWIRQILTFMIKIRYVQPTELRLSKNYIIWYTTWTWVAMTSLGPFFILTILNYIIYINLRHAMKNIRELTTSSTLQRQSQVEEKKVSFSSTSILICTVSMFLICNLPRLATVKDMYKKERNFVYLVLS